MDGCGSGAGPYGDIYATLSGALDPGMCNVAPGTDCTIVRALAHFRAANDPEAVRRLEKIALTIFALQQALRDRSMAEYRRRRRTLLRETRAWLDGAPMVA